MSKNTAEIRIYLRGMFVCVVLLVVIVYLNYHSKYAPLIELNSRELEQLEKSKRIVCEIDLIVCDVIKQRAILYKVYDYIFPLRWGSYRRAETNLLGSVYTIKLAPGLFSDITVLTMYLYHELQHVNLTDTRVYSGQLSEKEVCLNHNVVKLATAKFAPRLDFWFRENIQYHPKVLAADVAQNYGNRIEDCDLY